MGQAGNTIKSSDVSLLKAIDIHIHLEGIEYIEKLKLQFAEVIDTVAGIDRVEIKRFLQDLCAEVSKPTYYQTVNKINESMKDLELRRTETKRARGKFKYEVVENGKVLAQRISSREYVACYVVRHSFEDNTISYYLPYFFGRFDLIGKGSSQNTAESAYGLAKIKSNV